MGSNENDRQSIANLVFRYAECIDSGDFEGVSELLAHADVTNEGIPGVTRGREAVLALYTGTTRRFEATGTPCTHHVTTNLIIEIEDGSLATCRSKFTVFQQTPQLPLQPIIAGRYHDRFERPDERWRFAARHIFCDLFGDLGQHLLFDAESIPRS